MERQESALYYQRNNRRRKPTKYDLEDNHYLEVNIVHKTPKAYLVKDFFGVKAWLPISLITVLDARGAVRVGDRVTLAISNRLAKQKGFLESEA